MPFQKLSWILVLPLAWCLACGEELIVDQGPADNPDENVPVDTVPEPAIFSVSDVSFDAVTVEFVGPTAQTVTLTLDGADWTGIVPTLQAGTYDIVLLGMVASEVDYFGLLEDVDVSSTWMPPAVLNFASFRPAVSSLSASPAGEVSMTFTAVAHASYYVVEHDTAVSFPTPVSVDTSETSLTLPFTEFGKRYVRVRAVNEYVSNGRASEIDSLEVIDVCGNAVGNGNTLISGPTAPSGSDYDQVFRSLAVDPSDPNTVYVGTERNGIVKTSDGGTNWVRSRMGMRHLDVGYPEVWDLAVSPHNPSVLIAATLDSPGPVTGDYPSSIAGVYRSSDAGATWTRSNCGFENSRAVSVRFDPNDSVAVLLGIEGGQATFSALQGEYFSGALMRSTDAGLTWSPATTPAGADRNGYWHLRARGQGTTEFLTFGFNYYDLGESLGFLRSTDGGQTFAQFASALSDVLITGIGVSADGQVIYANERDSYRILRSLDAGVTWDSVFTQANGTVRVSPADPGRVLFEANGTVFLSTDSLATYSTVLTAPQRVDDIEFALSNPDIVYAAAAGYSIYRSDDGGASWLLLVNLRTDGVIN